MSVNLEEMLNRLPAERRQKVKARAAELIVEEMSLRDLRKAMGKTQVALAEKLGLKQENISRIEQRTDLLLSTLDGYLKALGGNLRLVVEFEGRAPVTLSSFAALEETHKPITGRASSNGRKKGSLTARILVNGR